MKSETVQFEAPTAVAVQRLVRHWRDLAEVPESETHRLEINVENCNGWIKDKRDPEAFGHYLSTHTFYGSKHEYSTRLLRQCGFDVTIANWDAPNVSDQRPGDRDATKNKSSGIAGFAEAHG